MAIGIPEVALGCSAGSAVDAAIGQYERSKDEKDVWRIRNAFEDWKRAEGSRWQLCDRNRKQAITRIDRELAKVTDARTYQITHMTMKELMALSHIARQRKRVLENVFKGKEVTLKGAKLKEQIVEAGEKIKSKCQTAESWISANKAPPASNKPAPPDPTLLRDKMLNMAKSFFGVAALDDLGSLAGLILDIMGKCGAQRAAGGWTYQGWLRPLHGLGQSGRRHVQAAQHFGARLRHRYGSTVECICGLEEMPGG